MKKTYLIFLFFITAIGYSQSHGISYQAVLLNPKGEQLPGQNNNYSPLLDKNVCLRFEIKNSNDQLEYQETINTKTDSFGMVNLIIGSGNQTGGTAVNFNAISWNAIQKKLVVALDSEGNCNSFIEISNQDFTGVPFAFSSQNSENVTGIVAIANGGTNATTASAARTNLGLGNVNNTSDANKPISTVTQTALDTKEDKSNKSDNIISDATSITKYPSVKAIKDYIDSQSGTTGTVADATMANKGKIQLAGDLTGTASTPVIANNVITDAKVANGISASKVGLGNVDNTSDANKPVSAATQTALNLKANTSDLTSEISRATTAEALKAPLASPTFTGTVSGIDKTMVGLGNVDNTSDANKPISAATQTALNLKANTSDLTSEISRATTAEALKAPLASPTFTGTVSGIDKTMVGLGNVDNTSDANKPVSTATQTALNLKANTSDLTSEISRATTAEALKAPLASPTFTGTVSGIDKTMVGLGNVDNTSDANKPVSTATQTALNLKQNLLTNPITGTGTLNTMPKFTAGSVLGNSTISDDGTVVTISSPVKIQTLTLGSGGGAISTNTVFGKDALLANTTGVNNTAIGFESLISNTTGPSNTAIGINASRQNTTGGANVAIGINALMNNLTGANNTAVGAGALVNATGNNNSAFGLNSLLNFSSGSNVTAYGVNSGRFAGAATTTMTSANNSIYLGYLTRGLNATGSTNEVVIGNDVVGLGSNTTVLGNSSTTKSAIYGNLLLGSTTDNSTGAKLQVTGGVTVDGAITNNSSNNANSNATIDFSLSNIAYTSATSNAITITNIRDGGTYNLAITATTVSDKVIFIAPSGFTIRDMGTVNRVLGKIHLYRLVVAGTNVLVTMSIEN
jgi:hypothetical protein